MASNTVIRLKNVDIYQQKHLVLSNVNLEIGNGEFIYLIGQSGSGKSSLLKIIYGELHIADGEGLVAGFDLKKLKENDVPFFATQIRDRISGFSFIERSYRREKLRICAKSHRLD